MKRKLLLAFCALLIGWSYASAQEIGDQYVVGTSVYQITGSNLITNGSFDDGVSGWYNGAWTANSIENSTVTNTGGYDDGAYITISAAGAGSTSTLRNVIPVESGKTYLFRCYTSGQTPSRANIGFSGLWKGTGANGHTEGDQLYRLQWGERCAASTNSWTVNNYIFTPDEYTFVVIRSSWNANTKLDGFFIGEVSKVKDISETVSLGSWTGNANPNGSGQHWDGTSSTKYYDNASWWASTTFEETQNVDLPAGAYVLKAAGRGAANDGTDAYISLDGNNLFFWSKGDTGKGIDTSGAENYSSDGTYANNNNGRGWEWRNLPLLLFEGKNGVTAKFGYRVNYKSNPGSSWSWAGICEPTLYKTELTTAMIFPDLRIAIAKGQKINDKNAAGSRAISAVLSAAKAISLSSSVSDATTAYNALLAAIPIASDYAEKYALLDNEITKAAAMDIASSDISTAEAVRDNSSSTADQLVAATQNLMVAEYNYATENYATPIDLGSWTETGTNTMPATFSNEHWSGTTREYKNQDDSNSQGWWASTWSMGLNQDITLPAGDYVFKVAGRKSADATMTLTVTNTSTSAVLGTVADFPSGNSSRGINKSGATAFEGDDADFAHDGAGYGWQWRYVPFSLNEETTVNIAVEAGTTKQYNWASFGDYAVWSKPNVAASTIAYNKAVEDAGTAKTTYPQVTGTELTELNDALDADKGYTVETIDAATAVIKTKTSALIAAAPSYDAYLLAKGYGEAINSTLLPYASTAKLTAVTEALGTSVTSAATAVTATTAINTANRAAYESNMNAEGVGGATNRTSLIKNADGNNTAGWTGSFSTRSGEPYTDASGSSTNTYFDKNGIKSFTSSQTIKLVAGTYILSVTARAQAGIDSYKLKVTNNADETEEVALTAMGSANGVFNRGWNVATVEFTQKAFGDATISIEADNTTSDANFWMSWDRFRLVSIAEEGKYEISEDVNAAISNYSDVDVTLTRTIKADTWNTFVVPFAINNTDLKAAFGNDVAIAEYSETADGDNSDIAFNTMATPAVAANTPVLLKTSTAGTSYTFTERNIVEGEAKVEGENYDFVGSYMASINLEDGDYFISSNNLYKNEGATVTLKGTRAYIKANGTPNNVKILNFVIGDGSATGIEAPEVTEAEEEEILYNTAGVRVGKDYKGIVINQKGEKRLQK